MRSIVSVLKDSFIPRITFLMYVFFVQVGEYQKAGVMAKKEDMKFTLDADF